MSYRYEKNRNGENDLVIDGFEKGIADSPFEGIGLIKNLNIRYRKGVAYVNYKRKPSVLTLSGVLLTGAVAGAGTSATLLSTAATFPNGWTLKTSVLSVTFSNSDVRSVTFTKGSNNITWTGGLTGGGGTTTITIDMAGSIVSAKWGTQSPAGLIYFVDSFSNCWKQSAVNSSTFSPVLGATSAGNANSGIQFWNNYLFLVGGDTNGKIEICGDGAGDSTVTSSNWNTAANSAVTVTMTIPVAPVTTFVVSRPSTYLVFTSIAHGFVNGDPISFTLTGAGSLPTGLTVNKTYYVSAAGADTFAVALIVNGILVDGTLTSGDLTGTGSSIFTANNHGLVGGQVVRFTTTGTLPTGISTGTNYYVTANSTTSTGNITTNTFMVTTTAILALTTLNGKTTTGSQSGTHSFISQTGVWPITNTNIALTAVVLKAATSATLSSYTDGNGLSIEVWNGPTGIYNLHMAQLNGRSQVVTANLTQGSNAITFTPALNETMTSAGFASVPLFYNGSVASQTGVLHMCYKAMNDGDFYFSNGSNLGALREVDQQVFDKKNMNTFTFYSNILGLPTEETSVYISELDNRLIVAGVQRLYPWDFSSPFWNNPIPMDEKIHSVTNILNNLYILAGNKGNIYQSNGYSVMRYKKLPDYISGVTDPAWLYGGVMSHRQRFWFQAIAINGQTGAKLLGGTFSMDLDDNSIVMEGEPSIGPLPAALTQEGILVPVYDTTIDYEKYYSLYSGTTSSMDFNDTALWTTEEAIIETDMIPIGTFAQPRTFTTMEFKLDRPMQSGDAIKVKVRSSLSAAWVTIGTSTTTILSDLYKSNFQKYQWAQFQILLSCNTSSTASSFTPIREIRIR